MDFTRLSKLRLPDVGQPKDLYTCGELLYYDKSYDRVSVKSEKPLKRVNKEFHKVCCYVKARILMLNGSVLFVFAWYQIFIRPTKVQGRGKNFSPRFC